MEQAIKTKLGLNLPTDPRWVNLAEMELEYILTDHAYCEQKATTSCISLIQQYPERIALVEELTPVVAEEWSHFTLVLEEMKKRGIQLGPQRKDEYVNKLKEFSRGGGSQTQRLVEKLLTFALIEARSCERFRLLSLYISEDDLKEFYKGFMVSEAGHYKMFLRLAKLYGGEEYAENRWKEYLAYEASMLQTLEVRGDRIH